MTRSVILAGILIGALLSAAAFAADEEPSRQPVPLPAQQQDAVAKLYATLKPELSRRGADLQAVAARLVRDADQATDDAVRYVTYREARDLAVRVGDAAVAMSAIDGLTRHFRVPDFAQRAEVLLTIGRSVREPEMAMRFLRASTAFLEPAIRADAFDKAEPLLSLTERIARSVSARREGAETAQKVSAWKSCAREFIWAGPAIARIKKDPEDAEANLRVGRYYCFIKAEWDRGLLALSRCSDEQLRAAAAIDFTAQRALASEKPGEREAQIDLIEKLMQAAESWTRTAATRPEPYRAAVLERAVYWLLAARPRVGDDARGRIDRDIDEAQTKIRARPASLAKLTDAEFARVITFRDRYYLFIPNRRELAETLAAAGERQALLATAPDDDANTFMRELMKDMGVPRLWLGAERSSDKPGWRWTDGTPWGFTNWAPGEPKPGSGLLLNAEGKWSAADTGPASSLLMWVALPEPPATRPATTGPR